MLNVYTVDNEGAHLIAAGTDHKTADLYRRACRNVEAHPVASDPYAEIEEKKVDRGGEMAQKARQLGARFFLRQLAQPLNNWD